MAHRRTQTGAAAVEAALVLCFFLLPLLVGLVQVGQFLWEAQRVAPYPPRSTEGQVVGRFTCAELVDRVKTTVAGAMTSAVTATSAPVALSDISVKVLQVLPTVGAVVEVRVQVPVTGFLGSLVGGNVVQESTMRLERVQVTTESCL